LEVLVTPKEREIIPQAFKRVKEGDKNLIDMKNPNHSSNQKKGDLLKYKRENNKLTREIEKMKKAHEENIQKLNQEFEDKLAEALMEKEKEHALIIDAKIIEHEDQILETENRLHREYIVKIAQYQEIIKELKNENQDLYEENSLKQKKLDENVESIK